MPTTNTPTGEACSLEGSPCQSQESRGNDLGFGRRNRLLSSSEFKAVFDGTAYKASNRNLLLLAIPGQSPRLGLVVAKKHVRLAVQRNRLKRLLRESFRHHQHELAGLDIVALVKPGLWQQDNCAIRKIIDSQWRHLLKQKAKPDPVKSGSQPFNEQKKP